VPEIPIEHPLAPDPELLKLSNGAFADRMLHEVAMIMAALGAGARGPSYYRACQVTAQAAYRLRQAAPEPETDVIDMTTLLRKAAKSVPEDSYLRAEGERLAAAEVSKLRRNCIPAAKADPEPGGPVPPLDPSWVADQLAHGGPPPFMDSYRLRVDDALETLRLEGISAGVQVLGRDRVIAWIGDVSRALSRGPILWHRADPADDVLFHSFGGPKVLEEATDWLLGQREKRA
jgi:hypothetical protein